MWARSRLDIGWPDLLSAALSTCTPGGPDPETLAERWDRDGAVFLTVRTAWDALLAELKLEPGEAVVSAINIPDMFELLEHHGIVPVPVDIDPATLAPAPGALAAATTERTRLVLVTHLLGSRVDMDAVHAELGEAGVTAPVIEDCAQAFEGPHERGHARSLAALFSFGPIKSNSALGGCLARVSDGALREGMLARTRSYPRQSRRDYLGTVSKYAVLKAMTAPHAYGAFVRACDLMGRCHDEVINGAVLGLAGDEYWAALRRRPCEPLLAVLERRIEGFDGERLARRREHGEALSDQLGGAVPVLGAAAPWRSWWQVAVLSEEPEALVARLRSAGFDATRGASRLGGPVRDAQSSSPPSTGTPPTSASTLAPTPRADAAMAALVYVPAYPELPADELARLAELILDMEEAA